MAEFLERNYDVFFDKYNQLLQSTNYVTKRQSLKVCTAPIDCCRMCPVVMNERRGRHFFSLLAETCVTYNTFVDVYKKKIVVGRDSLGQD